MESAVSLFCRCNDLLDRDRYFTLASRSDCLIDGSPFCTTHPTILYLHQALNKVFVEMLFQFVAGVSCQNNSISHGYYREPQQLLSFNIGQ